MSKIRTGQIDANSEAWASWTPTLTNLSGGTLNYAKYTQIGKTINFRWMYTLAGAGVSGAITFSLPVTAASDYSTSGALDIIGNANITDNGVSAYVGRTMINSTTTGTIRPENAGSSFSVLQATSSTVPFTWGSGDFIVSSGTYESA
jgi:hypothetical protein